MTTNYIGARSGPEPLTVDKAQLRIVTHIHNAAHGDITNTTVVPGTIVHDTANVTGDVSGFPIPAVSFTLNGNPVANDPAGEVGLHGTHGGLGSAGGRWLLYNATFAGDGNYPGATSADEPLTARTFGKTMGYWHNKNGQALLAAHDAFSAANAVTLGEPNVSATDHRCNVTVNTAAKSLTILPTPNGASLIAQ